MCVFVSGFNHLQCYPLVTFIIDVWLLGITWLVRVHDYVIIRDDLFLILQCLSERLELISFARLRRSLIVAIMGITPFSLRKDAFWRLVLPIVSCYHP